MDYQSAGKGHAEALQNLVVGGSYPGLLVGQGLQLLMVAFLIFLYCTMRSTSACESVTPDLPQIPNPNPTQGSAALFSKHWAKSKPYNECRRVVRVPTLACNFVTSVQIRPTSNNHHGDHSYVKRC